MGLQLGVGTDRACLTLTRYPTGPGILHAARFWESTL